MITQIVFTTGHVSIRRGRITRQYQPTLASIQRLSNLEYYGPVGTKRTNRSTIATWEGLSTLNQTQRNLYALYRDAWMDYDQHEQALYKLARERNCYAHQLSDYAHTQSLLHYFYGIQDCCRSAGIHPVLLDLVHPCQHGNAQSRCYTCYTTP